MELYPRPPTLASQKDHRFLRKSRMEVSIKDYLGGSQMKTKALQQNLLYVFHFNVREDVVKYLLYSNVLDSSDILLRLGTK